jgi:hypothetical protein
VKPTLTSEDDHDRPELHYCTFCKREHHFGFDEVGAQLELLACRKGQLSQATKHPATGKGER